MDEDHINFVEQIILEDLASGKNGSRVRTRFPPEPNGYLHIGHAKSICLNFGLARKYKGQCNLRFDDTNPTKEDTEYVDSIMGDVKWLGFTWHELHYASDYFEQLYQYAATLIQQGNAYVCDLNAEEMRTYRGTLTEPGKNSPTRDRSVEENLKLLEQMKDGKFADGEKTLRAKINMASPNLNLRDPVLYRILHAHHHRTGDHWCIYPMYDFAHGQSDSIEAITHSVCTLEFADHRPLYDWLIGKLDIHHPQQIEFARLNLTYTVMSKRKLLQLVRDGLVRGWDDPRMPTIGGLRRRGYTPASIRNFCQTIGVAKFNSTIDMVVLENAIRDHLNETAIRVMGVLQPLRVVITNLPEGHVESLEAVNNPEDSMAGTRAIPFSREIFIERSDFMEEPPKGYFRLSPGKEVRLRYAYFITCEEVVKNDAGEVVELRCTYDPLTKGGQAPDGRKVKGTIHWVSAAECIDAEIRLYDHLCQTPDPDEVEKGKSWLDNLNPNSLQIITDAKLEPSLKSVAPGDQFQFERTGYFCVDPDSKPGALVFNRTVQLKDTWAKQQAGKKRCARLVPTRDSKRLRQANSILVSRCHRARAQPIWLGPKR